MAEYIDVKNVKSLIEVAIEDSWELDYTLERLEQIKTSDVIEHSKVKQAREEIENEIKFWNEETTYPKPYTSEIRKAKANSYKHCLEILDELIAVSEGE